MDPNGSDTARSYLMMIGVSVFFILLCFLGYFYVWQGVLLLSILTFIIWDAIRVGRRQNVETDPDDLEGGDIHMSGSKVAMYLAVGLIGLPLGAHFLIVGAVDVAKAWGLSEALDLWVMLLSSLLLIPFVFMGYRFTRTTGVIFTSLYVAYLALIVS